MNQFERIQQLILCIYEGGMPFDKAIFELTGERPGLYNRIKARQLITGYIDTQNDLPANSKHPILNLSPQQLFILTEHIKTELNGGKADLGFTVPYFF